MCGIIGIVAHEPVNQDIYDGLTVLQHRGQDAAGIITCEGERLHLRKNNGLVRDVFHNRHMSRMFGSMGIGHVRYPTAGCESSAEAQPFYVNSPTESPWHITVILPMQTRSSRSCSRKTCARSTPTRIPRCY